MHNNLNVTEMVDNLTQMLAIWLREVRGIQRTGWENTMEKK